jgi:hypothetical protein
LPQYFRIYDTKCIGHTTCDAKAVLVFLASTLLSYCLA